MLENKLLAHSVVLQEEISLLYIKFKKCYLKQHPKTHHLHSHPLLSSYFSFLSPFLGSQNKQEQRQNHINKNTTQSCSQQMLVPRDYRRDVRDASSLFSKNSPSLHESKLWFRVNVFTYLCPICSLRNSSAGPLQHNNESEQTSVNYVYYAMNDRDLATPR